MQKVKQLLTCSRSFTSPSSPAADHHAQQHRDCSQGSDGSGNQRLVMLANRPRRPRLQVEPEYAFSSVERQLRKRVETNLLPRINQVVQLCRLPEGAKIPVYEAALMLQNQLEKRAKGILVNEYDGTPIGGGDDLEAAVRKLEDQVENYFRNNPEVPRPVLRPRLVVAGPSQQADPPLPSRFPSVPAIVLKNSPVTRPGSKANISPEVMRAALDIVKVHSQTSSAMNDPENVLKTNVENLLHAIRDDRPGNIMAVSTAKDNNSNPAHLVQALKQLVSSCPKLL